MDNGRKPWFPGRPRDPLGKEPGSGFGGSGGGFGGSGDTCDAGGGGGDSGCGLCLSGEISPLPSSGDPMLGCGVAGVYFDPVTRVFIDTCAIVP
jgi:hypothetical protein